MKKLVVAAILSMLFLTACKKKKDQGDGCSETALQVVTAPGNNTTEPPSPGPNFPLSITVNTGLPVGGVTIEIRARPESGGGPFFTASREGVTIANSTFTITQTPVGVPCLVEISVTSKSCSTNKWTGSYRYSRK